MVKKVLSLALLLCSIICMNAQQPTPMPLNPNVRHGVLPNGLNYYILHNEEPKDRANFYIAQKVGSTLETPQQLGLAHFLEHMAFNGTTHFPGKTMLNYLQSKGIRFGADINAYTAFDETVYNIDNIPTTDKNLMDSVLLVLHDWSGSILLENDEIDAERGVIEQEYIMRNDADTRFFTQALPKVYQEYQYQQMPIGKMDIVLHFPYQDIKDYYKKWYRPDQQGIIIVGDFDVDEMENKVKAIFSDIVMPENAAERTYPVVSDNKEPIYFAMQDPEMQYSLTRIMFKRDKVPVEYRNTIEAYAQSQLIENLIATMLNARLSELSQKPECPYAYAGAGFGDFLVSKTKGAFSVAVMAKGNNMNEAVAAAMAEVARTCKTGFSESELNRAKDQMLANYEKIYNERNKTNTAGLAKELIRFFVDNEPAPGIEHEFELVKQLMPFVNAQACNAFAQTLLTQENQVITVQMPEKDMTLPADGEIIATINNAINAEYEAYVDQVITEPLIAKLPKKGTVKKTVENPKFGTTEMTLSNGAKVVVKPTDFASDQIIFMAEKKGGKNTYNPACPKDMNAIQIMDIAAEISKFGTFDQTMLEKYLAGKKVALSYGLGNTTTSVNGSSTKKDLATLMELIYSQFTNLQPDNERFTATQSQLKAMIENQDKNPQKIFSDSLYTNWYDHNPIFNQLNAKMIENADYAYSLSLVKASLSNAADYTFFFTGNVDANTLKPLLEQYIATLPSKKKPSEIKTYPIRQTPGIVNNVFKCKSETPTVIAAGIYSGDNLEYNIKNSVMISIAGNILSNIYTRTLREEEGGVYSPYAGGNISLMTGEWSMLYQVQTKEEKREVILRRAHEEFMKLLKDGASSDDFSKVREAALKQYEINVKKNGYWVNNLSTYYTFGKDNITDHEAAIKNLTLEEFNTFLKNLYNGKNRIDVVLLGEK